MGFCLFGVIGDCKESKETLNTIKMQTTVAQKIVEDNFTKITQEMKSTTANLNRIVANGRGDIIIENIKMSQVAELTADGKMKMEMSVKSDTLMSTLVDEAAKIALEIQNKNTGGNRSTYTKTEQEAITYMKSELIKNTNTNLYAGCVSSILNTNEIKAETQGNIIIRAIIMEQVSTLASRCVISTFLSQIKKVQVNHDIKRRLEEESRIVDHGLFDGTTALIIGASAVFMVVLVVVATRSRGNDKENKE